MKVRSVVHLSASLVVFAGLFAASGRVLADGDGAFHTRMGAIVYSPDGAKLAAIRENHVDVMDAHTLTVDKSWPITLAPASKPWIAYLPDGMLFVDAGGRMSIIDTEDGHVRPTVASGVESAAISADGTLLATINTRDVLSLRNLRTDAILWSRPKTVPGRLLFSPNGRMIAWAVGDIKLLSAKNGALLSHTPKLGASVAGLAFSPDSGTLAYTTSNGDANVFSL